MSTTDRANSQRLQRLLERRQDIADACTAALAHGSRRVHGLYALLAEIEDQLEQDHPRVLAAHLGAWVTHDADQLASHQRSAVTACVYCQAELSPATPSLRARTA